MGRYEEDTATVTLAAAEAFELAHADAYDDELPPSPSELQDEPSLPEQVADLPDR